MLLCLQQDHNNNNNNNDTALAAGEGAPLSDHNKLFSFNFEVRFCDKILSFDHVNHLDLKCFCVIIFCQNLKCAIELDNELAVHFCQQLLLCDTSKVVKQMHLKSLNILMQRPKMVLLMGFIGHCVERNAVKVDTHIKVCQSDTHNRAFTNFNLMGSSISASVAGIKPFFPRPFAVFWPLVHWSLN